MNMKWMRVNFLLIGGCAVLSLSANPVFGCQFNLAAQIADQVFCASFVCQELEEVDREPAEQKPVPAEESAADDKASEVPSASADEAVTDTAGPVENTAIGDQFIRFHMWDGSIVGGEVTVDKIEVETEFGTLQVPIKDIQKFFPGLNSIPTLQSKIVRLVEELGDKNFDVRETAHRQLIEMGMQLRNEIQLFADDGSAERKKHLEEIKKQIDEMAGEVDEMESEAVERALIRGDLIVTGEFSIVGKIKQGEFTLTSKFGQLSVNLADIKMADRTFNHSREDVRKSVVVSGTAFFQKAPVSTRIRVNRGDKIKIQATGVVNWTNWSTTSGPDGIDNQGQWQGENSGTLMARIGTGDHYYKVGSTGEFVAKQSGVLYLGVAMRDNYVQNDGYRWDGEYTAKIVVKPAN